MTGSSANHAHDKPSAARSPSTFFLSTRNDCPWCASVALANRLQTVDLFQRKDGRFTLSYCKVCGHVFQNPQLSGQGLSHYYRDFYDGNGADRIREIFARNGKVYRHRARAVAAIQAGPALWLDVGAGYGHFCETAREVFSGTEFHGTDMSSGIDEAFEVGRIQRGFREPLSDLSQRSTGSYDVVSMFHYLEHTTDPKDELRHAANLLKRDGILVVEVPNIRCPLSRWLGRYWMPWLQPQHLHFIPADNMVKELTLMGFQIEHCDSCSPHSPVNLSAALLLWLNHRLPKEGAPWCQTRPSLLSRIVRLATFVVAAPLLVLARGLDTWVVEPLLEATGQNIAYRLIARKVS